jgi:hypothetical protein
MLIHAMRGRAAFCASALPGEASAAARPASSRRLSVFVEPSS